MINVIELLKDTTCQITFKGCNYNVAVITGNVQIWHYSREWQYINSLLMLGWLQEDTATKTFRPLSDLAYDYLWMEVRQTITREKFLPRFSTPPHNPRKPPN